jgi:Protein kinase domain
VRDTLLANRFRIGDRVGSGGMGEVWAALDTRMQREVAVKLVQPLPVMGEMDTQIRFRREVQLAGRLSHRNIVTVHDWGETTVGGRETLFLVMELVSGVSLRQRLRESVPAWPVAVGWAAQTAQALDAAHRHAVVHRDIKPANVLLTPEGLVKVLDFGVAKFIGDTVRVNELTATGAPIGSPPYMSPEQAKGDRGIDHRTDLYSLGCLLYEAVTGRPPFVAGSHYAVLRMQVDDPPVAPRTLVPDLPEPLDALILHLLAKEPEDRPADAAAVSAALGEILVGHVAALPTDEDLDSVHLVGADALTRRILAGARRVRQEAEAAAADVLRKAEELRAAAEQEMRRAEEGAQALLQERETLAVQRAAVAEREASEILDRARRDAAAKREEAEALFEETRAKAAQAAADFETNLAKRRVQSERDLTARQAAAEKRLSEVQDQADELSRQNERLQADAERRAVEIRLAAESQAETIKKQAAAEAARERLAKLEQADALFEETRAKATQAAADFETNLAKRRRQAESDLLSQLATQERRAEEKEKMAEAMVREAARLHDETQARARETTEAAQREADAVMAQAQERAAELRRPLESELAHLTELRADADAQLVTAREALAHIIGAGNSVPNALPPMTVEFARTRGGYDPQQVDRQLDRLRKGLGLEAGFGGFDRVRRGYEPEHVDAYVAFLQSLQPR